MSGLDSHLEDTEMTDRPSILRKSETEALRALMAVASRSLANGHVVENVFEAHHISAAREGHTRRAL
jgi:hypothetical protein